MSRVAIDRWIDEGRYAEAAAALRARGELEPAQELFERIWDYPSALALAAERNDLLAQLRLSLLAGELDALARLRPALVAAAPALRERLAALLEQHQQLAFAAELYESAHNLDEALRCYELAGEELRCAQLHEQRGELGAAVRFYERILAATQPAGAEGTLEAQAQQGLGSVLLRLGRHEEAVRHLQRARALRLPELPAKLSPESAAAPIERTLDEIEIALVRSLSALGYPQVAQPIVLSYAARHPPEVPTVAEFIGRHAAANVATSAAAAPTVLLERYELVRLLGSGGMGRVYLATDQQTGRPVALKLLPAQGLTPGHKAGPLRQDAPAELWRRFVQEAQLLRGLHHPNIVQILDFHHDAAVLVMEYLPGGSLAQRPLPLPPAAVQRVLLDVLAALAVAHAAGVLHRDLKPHNLLCSATGETRLGDFGAAYLQGLGVTRTESFIGTLAYMAPEQLSGRPLTFATDLYALAVTAFQLLTGRLPFAGPDFIGQHLRETPPDPRSHAPSLDAGWSPFFARSLAKLPTGRFASVEEMRDAVQALSVAPDEPLARAEQEGRGVAAADDAALVADVPVRNSSSRVFVEGASPVLQTPYSEVVLGLEPRLGRPVLVERFHLAGSSREARAQQLEWLRALARLGGPGLQRILRIEDQDDRGLTVHYEVPVGPHADSTSRLEPADVSLLRRTLQRLHAAGIVHGAVADAVVCEPASALLLVHGRGPLGWSVSAPPSASDDLAQLQRLSAAA